MRKNTLVLTIILFLAPINHIQADTQMTKNRKDHTELVDLPNSVTPQRMDSGYANSDGLKIYYEKYGNGPPMILVHGWGSDGYSNWVASGWVTQLQNHRTLITIDTRGHGRSDKPYELDPYSYAAMSNDVIAVMDLLGYKKADFMGYSMGAFMGAYLLGHHPERFNSMVLGGIGDETDASAAQGDAIAHALRSIDPKTSKNSYATQVRKYVEANPLNDLESLAYSAQQMWPEGYPLEVAGANLSAATLPIIIVNGANDHPYVATADKLAAALPNARHIRIPDRDHLTVVGDPRFMETVVDFLSAPD